jgi:hypothetical protein
MAIGVYYHPAAMTAQQYDEVIRQLEATSVGVRPPGLIRHTCFGTDGGLRVFDLWESEQAFDEYAKVLGPIMQKAGLDLGTRDITPVHNMIF